MQSTSNDVICLPRWIEENKASFLPPVCNKLLYGDGQLKVMLVGGPNIRNDFHLEVGEELFYQLKGDMILKVIEQGKPKDILIKEGQIFVLPGHLPHSPQRFENTIGLVIERERALSEIDGLIWFQKDGVSPLYQEFFHCQDLGVQLKPVIERFRASEAYSNGVPDKNTQTPPPIKGDASLSTSVPIDLMQWIQSQKHHGLHGLYRCAEFQVNVVDAKQEEHLRPVTVHGEVFYYNLRGHTTMHEYEQDGKHSVLELHDGCAHLVKVGRRHHSIHHENSLCMIVQIQQLY